MNGTCLIPEFTSAASWRAGLFCLAADLNDRERSAFPLDNATALSQLLSLSRLTQQGSYLDRSRSRCRSGRWTSSHSGSRTVPRLSRPPRARFVRRTCRGCPPMVELMLAIARFGDRFGQAIERRQALARPCRRSPHSRRATSRSRHASDDAWGR